MSDTLSQLPWGSPARDSSAAYVKQCGSHFQIDSVSEYHLLGLANAYLYAGEDAQAERVFARIRTLVQKQSVARRAFKLQQIVTLLVKAAPVRMAAAARYVAALDSLGPPAATQRMNTHIEIASIAVRADSVPLIKRAAQAAVAASLEIPAAVAPEHVTRMMLAREFLAYLASRNGDGQGAIAILQKGVEDLRPIDSTIGRQVVSTIKRLSLLGKPAPRVQATWWADYQVPAGTDTTAVYPKPGVRSIVVFGSHNCRFGCYRTYAMIKRLKTTFPDLNVVFLTLTEGYILNDLVLPSVEADSASNYLLKQLQLPITLAVWNAQLGHRADGRLIVQSNPNRAAYFPDMGRDFPAYVIARDGTIRFISSLITRNEAVLRSVIGTL